MRMLLCLLIALLFPFAATAQEKKQRPNILILIADDWSWPHAGMYGDKVVKTPNIDKVARDGMLFHRAYCVSPSCTPSRGAVLTGQWVHRLKEGGNLWSVLPIEFDTLPDILARLGYFSGHTRKGWGPGSIEGTTRTHNPAGPKFNDFAQFLKALPPDRPFCFWFGSTDPHRPYTAGSGKQAGLKMDDVKVPPFFPDTPTTRSDILDYYAEVQQLDSDIGAVLEQLEKSGRAENTIVLIMSDNGMPFPRCKANLYEMGTHMPLVVRWPARVTAGRESKAFISYQDVTPTLLEAIGVERPKQMSGHSFLDILTGKGDGAERDCVFVERERHANVRRGDLSYPSRAIRTEKFAYIRNFRPDRWPAGDPMTYFSVGPYGDIDDGPTKREILTFENSDDPQKRRLFELSCAKRPAEELYDRSTDPFEMKNVADDPAYAKAKMELRERLQRWMRETDDPRAGNGGDDRWDRYPYNGGPAEKKAKQKNE